MPTIHFKGKTFDQNHHLAVKYHQLLPKKELSLTDKVSLHDNLIIQGDNLKALKALLPTYAGKVKCVCIDPPYNTGNENWKYNDNVNSPMMQEWLGSTVDKEDLTRHDKWLCLMMPRLKLLRELMSEDGAIFIFCDDNEQHRLRLLMDELFGETNFVANVIWQHSIQGKGYSEKFSVHHNHLIIYQKSEDFALSTLERTEENNKNYSNPDKDPNGDWRTGDIRNALYRPNLIYDVKTPSGKIIKPSANGWRFSKETMDKKIAAKQVVFNADETRLILKIYLKDVQGRVPETIWFGKDVGTTRDGKSVLKELFGGEAPFETPKPVEIIKQIIKIMILIDMIIINLFKFKSNFF
jgi:adenine-specific DNA-methyltransferase